MWSASALFSWCGTREAGPTEMPPACPKYRVEDTAVWGPATIAVRRHRGRAGASEVWFSDGGLGQARLFLSRLVPCSAARCHLIASADQARAQARRASRGTRAPPRGLGSSGGRVRGGRAACYGCAVDSNTIRRSVRSSHGHRGGGRSPRRESPGDRTLGRWRGGAGGPRPSSNDARALFRCYGPNR